MAKNSNLHAAKINKKDEFYTQLIDIEKELCNYKDFFKGKVVFCNCDDPLESNFTKYFILNFHHFGLKKLICTFYDVNGKTAYAFEYEGDDMNDDGVVNEKDIELIRQSGACRTILVDDEGFDHDNEEECWKNKIYGSGDFRSKNVIDYLKESDVVVTNPPFSLFREYVAQLMEYDKKFIIIGEQNAVTYKEIFPYVKENKLWWGVSIHSGDRKFYVPNDYPLNASTCGVDENGKRFVNVKGIRWWTNVENKNRAEELPLYKTYYGNESKYPKYDNYDAIEVGFTKDIPCDYDGVMGVPITFLDKYCPSQFEIVGITENADYLKPLYLNGCEKYDRPYINGKRMYSRLLIKKLSA